jgi:hypothetical protein
MEWDRECQSGFTGYNEYGAIGAAPHRAKREFWIHLGEPPNRVVRLRRGWATRGTLRAAITPEYRSQDRFPLTGGIMPFQSHLPCY